MNFIRVFDNGILPALTTTLKEEEGFTNLQIGSLGSLVYMGEVTGSIIAMPVYQKVPVKIVLLACIVLQSVSILGFAFSNGIYEVMALSRFFTGVFQVFISIFAPIWCDTYAPDDKKTTWITSLMVATPGGIVTGYLLTAVIISTGGPWEISFFLQVFFLIPIAIYIVSIDHQYLSLVIQENPVEEQETEEQKNKISKLNANDKKQRIFHRLYLERMRVESVKTANYSFRQNLSYLLCRGDFMSVLFTLTTLFLVMSGLQYWITDYVVSVLGHSKE